MHPALSWHFVDGDTPGDGELWLSHQDQLFGFVDIHDARDGVTRRIMTATDVWVRKQLDELRTPAQWSAFAAMIVVPAGKPEDVRSAIGAAIQTGAAHFASEVTPDEL